MSLLQAILLGIIQGLTEFLPISSSGHLVLVPYLLGWNIPPEQAFIFDVLVQIGTLLAVIVYFWKDLVAIVVGFVRALIHLKPFENPEARLGWYLILATIPAGLFGVTIKKTVEAAFNSPVATAIFLFVTAGLLFLAELVGKRTRPLESLGWLDALIIGLFQAVSIFPGVSRSGSTITGGMIRNFERPAAARFSFLMSVPVMLAAGLLESIDLVKSPELSAFLPVVLVGMAVAAVVGYFAIRWLLSYLMRHSLRVFAIYCIVLGAITIIVSYVRG
jgi:undecaprenyl-diphosphatase